MLVRRRALPTELFLALLFGCAVTSVAAGAQGSAWTPPPRAARQANPIAPDERAMARARQIYRKDCLPCHGAAGKGDGPKAPDLKVHPGDLSSAETLGQSDGALFWKITQGRTPMPSYRTYSERDRWLLVHVLRSFKQQPAPPVAAAQSKPTQTMPVVEEPRTNSALETALVPETVTQPEPTNSAIAVVEPPVRTEAIEAIVETNRFVSIEQYEALKADHEQLRLELEAIKATLAQSATNAPPADAAAEKQAETEESIAGLEQEVEDLRSQSERTVSGSTMPVLTGFASANFSAVDNSDARFSAVFTPILLWKMSDSLLFEGELDVNLANDETDLDLVRAQILYVLNDYMTVGAGKFLSPMNFLEDRLHQVGKLPDRPFAISTLLPDSNIGLQLRAVVPVGSMAWDYALYAANAPGIRSEAPDRLGELEFDNFSNRGGDIAVGGRVGWFPIPELQLGYGFQVSDVGGEDAVAWLHSLDFNYVRDSERLRGTVNLLAQWAWSDVDALVFDEDGSDGFGPVAFENRRDGGYVQLAYRPTMSRDPILQKVEPVIRYERLETSETFGGFVEERWTAGVNYWFLPSTVFKMAYRFADRDEGAGSDAVLLQFKVGY